LPALKSKILQEEEYASDCNPHENWGMYRKSRQKVAEIMDRITVNPFNNSAGCVKMQD
jgi:hypothetical protein